MSVIDEYKRNWTALEESDREAKAAGQLVGRFIMHPYADGNAVYRVTASKSRTATIEVVTGIGDDWVLPAWGNRINLPLKTVQQFIARRDAMEKLFGK